MFLKRKKNNYDEVINEQIENLKDKGYQFYYNREDRLNRNDHLIDINNNYAKKRVQAFLLVTIFVMCTVIMLYKKSDFLARFFAPDTHQFSNEIVKCIIAFKKIKNEPIYESVITIIPGQNIKISAGSKIEYFFYNKNGKIFLNLYSDFAQSKLLQKDEKYIFNFDVSQADMQAAILLEVYSKVFKINEKIIFSKEDEHNEKL